MFIPSLTLTILKTLIRTSCNQFTILFIIIQLVKKRLDQSRKKFMIHRQHRTITRRTATRVHRTPNQLRPIYRPTMFRVSPAQVTGFQIQAMELASARIILKHLMELLHRATTRRKRLMDHHIKHPMDHRTTMSLHRIIRHRQRWHQNIPKLKSPTAAGLSRS